MFCVQYYAVCLYICSVSAHNAHISQTKIQVQYYTLVVVCVVYTVCDAHSLPLWMKHLYIDSHQKVVVH